jgi:hypothetical protein
VSSVELFSSPRKRRIPALSGKARRTQATGRLMQHLHVLPLAFIVDVPRASNAKARSVSEIPTSSNNQLLKVMVLRQQSRYRGRRHLRSHIEDVPKYQYQTALDKSRLK